MTEPAQPPRYIAERYRVEQPLGEGGMGEIHRVFDPVTETHLALKQLRLEGDATFATHEVLFQREFQTLKQLAHPRIIRVFDYGIAADGPYYTMELLDGRDVRELAPLETSRACAVLRDVASSLALVHSRRLVHRDVSPRNVRCTSDGRAKLLDFGALAPMGVSRQLVGTPGYVPPEAIYGQPLDQRADLFSLGVLAYWLLTGRHPYPARRFEDVRDAFRTSPRQPSEFASAVPKALDTLVMSLLSQNPTARPQHAAEVIDLLTVIGQLPPDGEIGEMHAYLTTPELVGREAEVLRFRKAIVRATRGRGSAHLVRAEAGLGSSRLIDAFVLEAKLVGALVARVDASELGHDEFAAVRSVLEQWSNGLPARQAEELRAAAPSASLLGAGVAGTSADADAHARIVTAVLRVATQRTLALAADDAHRLDMASVAVFALLAQASEVHKLVICGSLPTSAPVNDSIPLRMLAEATRPVELRPWTLLQTESLLRSVFGAVPNVRSLADRVHRVAQGNPRDSMQLAQHLVDAGILRHQAGAWSLPTKLDEIALPTNLTQAQQRVIETLDEDTHKLAVTLALVPDLERLTLAECSRLSPDALAPFDALIREGVLAQRGGGFAFRHRDFAATLVEALDDAQHRALHRDLAALRAASGHHPLTIAYHLHHAGQAQECLRWVLPSLDIVITAALPAHQIEVIEAIACDSPRYPVSAPDAHRLRAVLVQHAVTSDPQYGRYGELSFEPLRHDVGLVYWDDYPDLEPAARIGRCLERAQAVYSATPPEQRGLAPFDAVRELALLVRNLTSVYARTLAADQLCGLAACLAPLCSLAPIMELLYELISTSVDRAVREKRVAHRYLAFAERFEQPIDGVDETVRHGAAAICLYVAALDEAKQGKSSALTRVESLEKVPAFAALAWHVRMLSHIYSGRTAEAAHCRLRMELLVILQDHPNTLLAMSVLYEAWGYELCEDMTGLKAALERVEQEAKRYPGWQP